ncbi:SAM-dependent methyltransferase [Taibaiella sp. KBW10]|uniref:class I SAM-dependent methyltransferase n=1 Tax=Taibaiella sp. KBW10 TaxID=2153357 RepID=UPI000F5B20DF|nr:class I SAM-dependent methyltransferase [Taibaiella sp. KBW10]RQO29919.1 SAM-dependent methyltransferase [Taibaiella sp. KBW10]
MKDLFSESSDLYARHRPQYPAALFAYLNTLVQDKDKAWDCGTGNGQVAAVLAETFTTVYATDISTAQIAAAAHKENLQYSIQAAEHTHFPDHCFALITVAQAIHWFDFEQFYAEVKRTAKANAILAVIGYGDIRISETIDPLMQDFHANTLGAYWDWERKYIDERYETIPFPFEAIAPPDFTITIDWTLEQLIAYINTWSALKHFIKANKYNPVDTLQQQIEPLWGKNLVRTVHFPLFLRIGKINPE